MLKLLPSCQPREGLQVVLKHDQLYGFLFFKTIFFSFSFFLNVKNTSVQQRQTRWAGGLHAGACIGCCRFVILIVFLNLKRT